MPDQDSPSLFSRAMDFIMGNGALKKAASTGAAAPAASMPQGAPPATEQSTDYLQQQINATKGLPKIGPVTPPLLPGKIPGVPAASKPTSMDLHSLLQLLGGNS